MCVGEASKYKQGRRFEALFGLQIGSQAENSSEKFRAFFLNKDIQKVSFLVFLSAYWVWKRFRENLALLAIVNFRHIWQARSLTHILKLKCSNSGMNSCIVSLSMTEVRASK